MSWFNYIGLIIIAIIMIPNVVFAMTNKDGFENEYKNKSVETLEQIGRFACFILMIFNIPYTYFGFWFAYGKLVYIIINSALVVAYVTGWVVFWHKDGMAKSVLLSVLPSLVFLFSGVTLSNIPLIAFSLVFAPCHILISVKNAK